MTDDERWTKEIWACLRGMRYGTVQIIVHEGKIVQIERTERRRFENQEGSSSSANGARTNRVNRKSPK